MKRLYQSLLLATVLISLATRAEVPEDAVWIDVRTPGEYAQGHIEGAVLIPFDGIEAGVAELGLSPDTPLYLYCAAGGRAERARQSLVSRGYSNVTNVGGLDDARALRSPGTAGNR